MSILPTWAVHIVKKFRIYIICLWNILHEGFSLQRNDSMVMQTIEVLSYKPFNPHPGDFHSIVSWGNSVRFNSTGFHSTCQLSTGGTAACNPPTLKAMVRINMSLTGQWRQVRPLRLRGRAEIAGLRRLFHDSETSCRNLEISDKFVSETHHCSLSARSITERYKFGRHLQPAVSCQVCVAAVRPCPALLPFSSPSDGRLQRFETRSQDI